MALKVNTSIESALVMRDWYCIRLLNLSLFHCYICQQSHLQRDRHHTEEDLIPQPKEFTKRVSDGSLEEMSSAAPAKPSKLQEAIKAAKAKVSRLVAMNAYLTLALRHSLCTLFLL